MAAFVRKWCMQHFDEKRENPTFRAPISL